jgi:CheY-like chemotaxis protein
VLIVDDEPLVLKVVSIVLERNGYGVLTAENPEQALSLCTESSTVDLLLVDLIMPGMTGTEFVPRCLQQFKTPPQYLFMSGYNDAALVEQGVTPPSPLLRKPFTPQTLLSTVRNILK